METESIILAIGSPPGWSARGIVRASGDGVFDLLDGYVGGGGDDSTKWRSRGAHIFRLRLSNAELPAILLAMPGPRSYTGEDTVEILTAGNPHLLNRIIDEIIDRAAEINLSARRAEAGEFTARAFLNRRLTLTEAEGVNATIRARSDAELRAAQLLTAGSLGELAHTLADELANALALVEAGIDFIDQEDVVAIAPRDLLNRLTQIRDRLKSQLDRSIGFEELAAIPWAVLVGPPNAGKSTLFNALLGRERAVVSVIAGTTRDILTEPMRLDTADGAGEVMLVDIAGLDDKTDPSEIGRLMQHAAREAIDRAELLIYCVPTDGSAVRDENRNGTDLAADDSIVESFSRNGEVIRVATKSDLVRSRSEDGLCDVAVSAKTGAGLDRLREMIAERLADRAVSLAADALALQPRHESAMRSALSRIEETIDLVGPHAADRSLPSTEFIAALMRVALDDLAMLAGDISPDDVLGRIFASFCVGK